MDALRICGLVRFAAAIAVVFTLTFAASASGASYVYVSNQGFSLGHSVSQYEIGPGGDLLPLSPPMADTSRAPTAIEVSPDGKSVYVTVIGGVNQYDVGSDGTLTPKDPANVEPVGPVGCEFGPLDVPAITPDGMNGYSGSCFSNLVHFGIDPQGVLSPSDTIHLERGVKGVAVSPDGSSLYVTSYYNPADVGAVSEFDIGPGGGLSPKPAQPTLAVGVNPSPPYLSPDGRSAYFIDTDRPGNARSILQYDIRADGTLSPKSAPAIPLEGILGAGSHTMAVAPDGRSAYLAAGDEVLQYNIGANGALHSMAPATVPASSGFFNLAVSPDSKSVYVNSYFSGDVLQYDVGADGALSPKDPPSVKAGSGPVDVAVTPPPPLPIRASQCSSGGWRTFGFKSPGRCIAFVVLTRLCDALERQHLHLRFCPPQPPSATSPSRASG